MVVARKPPPTYYPAAAANSPSVIISIMPPDEHGNADDAAWLRLAAAHARALDVYASESAEEITRHR